MTNPHILLEQMVVQAEGNIVSNMGREKVMMSVHNGKYYNLGEVGGRIWELIASPIVVTQLVDSLTLEYDIERTACERQVTSFLQHLYKEQLIQVLEGVPQS
jgi:hypothetical protein